MSRPPDANEARRRQIEAIRARAESERLDAQVDRVASAGAAVGLAFHCAVVLLAVYLMTRGGRMASTGGAALLIFDAVACMFLADSLARMALGSTSVRIVLALSFALGAVAALLTGLAGFTGKIGPFMPIAAKSAMALLATLFLVAYALAAGYLAAVLGLNTEEGLRSHRLFRKSEPPGAE